MRNAFDMEIPDISKISRYVGFPNYKLGDVLGYLYPEINKYKISGKIIELARFGDPASYEKEAHGILSDSGVISKVSDKFAERANIICGQIQPYVSGRVLDLGCGDGKVGQMLSTRGMDVTLSDVYKNPNIDSTGLSFAIFDQGESIPFDNKFDTTLLLTVLHHSDDPVKTLQEAARVTKDGGTIVVIESVYEICNELNRCTSRSDDNNVSWNDIHHREKYCGDLYEFWEGAKWYLQLSPKIQRHTNIFFDHFYNRVLHYSDDPAKKVNVPYNFNTPSGWKQIFEENGLEQEELIHLGIDQPAVPEYHTLHVLRKK